jgi:hypothetical protein
MKSQLKSRRSKHEIASAAQLKTQQNSRRSRPASAGAAPQSKTVPNRAGHCPASASPCIALFPEGDGGSDGNGGISAEVIDLSKAEYAALEQAAVASGDGILMFMANAALEKIGESGSSIPSKGGLTVAVQHPNGKVTNVEFNLEQRRRIEAVLKRTGIGLQRFMNMALSLFLDFADKVDSLSTAELIERLGKEARTRPAPQRRAA